MSPADHDAQRTIAVLLPSREREGRAVNAKKMYKNKNGLVQEKKIKMAGAKTRGRRMAVHSFPKKNQLFRSKFL